MELKDITFHYRPEKGGWFWVTTRGNRNVWTGAFRTQAAAERDALRALAKETGNDGDD
jgi:hypothetical protein